MAGTATKSTTRALPDDFEKIFRDHSRMVYRTAFRITGSSQDAEDVLQTLFMRLLRRENLPDLEGNPKGYLHRAAVNIALDVVKARNRHTSSSDLQTQLDDPGSAADREHRRSEIQEWLRSAFAELSPRAAEIFVLRHIEGLGNAEIAKVVGASRGTVAVTLFRARIQLKKAIRRLSGERP